MMIWQYECTSESVQLITARPGKRLRESGQTGNPLFRVLPQRRVKAWHPFICCEFTEQLPVLFSCGCNWTANGLQSKQVKDCLMSDYIQVDICILSCTYVSKSPGLGCICGTCFKKSSVAELQIEQKAYAVCEHFSSLCSRLRLSVGFWFLFTF